MKTSIAILSGIAALALAAPASATAYLVTLHKPATKSYYTGGFSSDTSGPGFDTFTFDSPVSGKVKIAITNADISLFTLTGATFGSDNDAHTYDGNGAETITLGYDPIPGAGEYSFTVSYSGAGSFGGNVTLVPSVPEPATWAMMLVGLGMIGFAVRRRGNVAITYA